MKLTQKIHQKINFLFVVFTVLVFYSCNRQSRDLSYEVNYLYCETEDEPSFINDNGCVCKIHSDDDVYPVINGYGLVNGVLYKFGSSVSDTTSILRDIEIAGVMNDGLIPICRENEHVTIIDENGNEICQLKEFEGKEVLGTYSYSDSKLRVILADGSYVFIDKQGRELFNTRFSWATDFRHGYAVVQRTNQNSHLFSFVEGKYATPIFTFESDDKGDIVISYDMELLSASEGGHCVIYDFSGKRILECPSKVYRIYAFCQEGFIYCDDEFGLMSYDGAYLIRTKYEQLVPHGQNYLALTDDDEIKLIDKSDIVIKEYDGREILDFRKEGYEFPNVIRVEYDHYMIIDKDGNVVGDDIDIDLENEEIKNLGVVRSDYFPSQNALNTVMDLCGNGRGVTDKYGAFFYRGEKHCYPQNISFLSSFTTQSLQDSKWARTRVEDGVNYEINYSVVFDEPIVRKGSTTLSTSAWLTNVELHIWMPNIFRNQAFLNACVAELCDKGCSTYYNKKTDYILLSSNREQIFVVYHNWANREYEFRINIMPNTETNRTYWTSYINNLK